MRKNRGFIFTFLLIILVCRTFAQDDSVKVKKIQLGFIISPDYCFRTLLNSDGSKFTDDLISFDNQIDKPKLGYTAGFNFCYNFSNNSALESGLQISNKGFAANPDALIFGIPPRRGSTSSSPVPTKIYFTYDYFYLDIPLKFNFILGNKGTRFFTGIGFTTGIFLDKQTTAIVQYSDGSTTTDRSYSKFFYNNFNLSPTLSFGAQFRISEKLIFRAEPTFRFGILKISDAPVASYLWNAGLIFGLYF